MATFCIAVVAKANYSAIRNAGLSASSTEVFFIPEKSAEFC